MLGLNRAIAWCLIIFMFMGSFSQYTWAEPTTTKKIPRKKRPTKKTNNPKKKPSTSAKKKKPSTKKSTVKTISNEKSLTKLQTSAVTEESKRRDAKDATKRLAPKNTPWTEEIDLLSAQGTGPILADSVFGARGKQKINLSAADLEIRVIMDQLASEYRLNIVSKAIGKGNKIKATLYDLPLETVFQVLLDQASLTYIKKNGIIYLQDSKVKDQFLDEDFYKLKQYADFDFALKLIENIATSKGKKIIKDPVKKTVFVIEYKRNLKRINDVLSELGYLEEMDPESSSYYYHYLSYNYVDKSVVSDIIKKYISKDGKSSSEEKSNRYLVFETKANFNKMKEALAFIDVPRGQVFVDVMFVDLNESDTDKLGIDTAFNWNADSPDNADQLITSLSSDVTNFFKLSNPSKITNIKVTGIKTNSKSRILNNPRIMVLNNETATIDVTEKFPYVTNENKSGVISSKIQNEDIGVTLKVTPRINANREVEMAVNPKITVLKEVRTIITKVVDTNQANAQATETSSEFPITDERSIDTKVVIPTGKTLVIGGLIKDTDRKAADSIPGLAKLPIFGSLFKRKNNGGEKSQLYIFITPTIVRNAPTSSTFTTDYGDERLTLFPKGSIEDEKKRRVSGLKIENSDSTPLNSPRAEQAKKLARQASESTDLAKAKETPVESKQIGESPVDFSSFLKKIKYLKERKSIASKKSEVKKVERKKKEKGFDNLIELLEKDIVHSEKVIQSKQKVASESVSKDLNNKIAQKKMDASDKVVGKRAQKIANLLNLWDEDPKDGLMADEDKKVVEKSSEKKSGVKSVKSKKNEKTSQATQARVEKPVARKVPKKRQVFAPLVEDAIEMKVLSPLDIGGFDKAKLLDVGKFNLGDTKIIDKKPKSSKAKSSKKSKRPKKRRKKKKLSYLEINEDLIFDDEMSSPKLSNGVNLAMDRIQEKHSDLKSRNHSEIKKISPVKSTRKNWQDDFFEKDLAVVVYNENVEHPQVQAKTLDKVLTVDKNVEQPVKKPAAQVKKSQLAKFINIPSKPKASDRVLKKAVATSTNPRTQQIFENLFTKNTSKNSPKKAVKQVNETKALARSSNLKTQKIFDNLLKTEKTVELPTSSFAKIPKEKRKIDPVKKSKEEGEFESFLDDMFSNANKVSEPVTKIKVKRPEAKKVVPKSKETLSKLEEEFMDFLEEL
ncbi:MAG: type II and III secretion system protein [Candidatus Cloacimonetes bacterium]|nr:type II and III secretion system protein [Candidatus Cloacimonadota bacterium]